MEGYNPGISFLEKLTYNACFKKTVTHLLPYTLYGSECVTVFLKQTLVSYMMWKIIHHFRKWFEIRKIIFIQNGSPKLTFLNEFLKIKKIKKVPSIFYIENWLWKSDFGLFDVAKEIASNFSQKMKCPGLSLGISLQQVWTCY